MSATESKLESISSLPAGRQVYELSYLLLPSIPEENVSQVVTNIEQVIEKNGGTRIDGEAPFLRELAYEMSKVVGASRYVVKNAYIGWVKFELSLEDEREAHPVEAIKSEIEAMNEVLRMLLVKSERETKFTFASARLAKESPEDEEVSEEVSEDADSDDNDSDTDEGVSDDEDDTVVE